MLYANAKEKQQVKDLQADYQCDMQLRTKPYECGSSCNEGGAKVAGFIESKHISQPSFNFPLCKRNR
jgi:hypothetical protein